jgi:hypothetical protein
MRALIATFAAVFALTFLSAPLMGAGWFWDAGNGLGFAAFAGLLYLTVTSARRTDLRLHQLLGYGVLSVALAHAFWFLLGDGAAVEFMKHGAPDYMWHGLVSVILLGVLITVALVPDRFRVHKDYPAFRYWHRVVAVATIATATYHIVASHFYLGTWYQSLLFAALAVAVAFGRPLRARLASQPVVGPPVYLAATLVFAALFALLRNVPA